MFNEKTIFGTIIKILDNSQVVVAVDECDYKELYSIDIEELTPYYQKDEHQLTDCKIYCTGEKNGNWLVNISNCEILVNVLDVEDVLYV